LLIFIENENRGSEDNDSDQHSVLLVTHGDFGKMIYAAYYDLDWEEVLKQFHFGNSEVLLLAKNSPPEKAHVFETSQFNP
jgi:broad specificity phosphatase PhoE